MTNIKSSFKVENIQKKFENATAQDLFNEGINLTINILLGSWAGGAIGGLVGQEEKGMKIGCALGVLARIDKLGRD